MKTKHNPPRLANLILSLFLKGREGIEKLGDLEEGFWIKTKKDGLTKAKLWYWLQTILAIPVCIKNSFTWGGIMFKNYIKIALRNIKKYKAYSTINILGLAIGMACCILILVWVQNELSYNNFHENEENLYRITLNVDGSAGENSPWVLLSYLKKDYPEIEKGSWYYNTEINVKYNNSNFNETIAMVEPEFLDMFTFPFVFGDQATAISNLNSVVISERIALKYFGDSNPIGKVLHLNNSTDLTVTAVMENVPINSDMQFDLIARPEIFLPKERFEMWRVDCPTYVQLTAGTNYIETTEKIKDTIIKYINHPLQWTIGLQPLKEIHLYSLNGTNPITYVYISIGLALLILIIACINFMNLSTARSALRAKEIGMRKVIGAKKSDVIKQFFSESIILSFLALIISLFFVYLLLPVLNEITETQLSLSLFNNLPMILVLILIALITGIISGIYPSLYLSSFQPAQIMKNAFSKSGRGKFLRSGLIIFQFTVATILIISTSIILKQMNYIRSKDIGLNRDNIVTIVMNNELIEKYEIVKQRLTNEKDIINVTSASSLPVRVGGTQGVYWEGLSLAEAKMFSFINADFDYFKTFGMKISTGRSFSKDHPTDIESFIINETAQKMMGFKNPIGQNIWAGKEGKIIGVVKDFHANSLHDEIQPAVFMMEYPVPKRDLFIKINGSNIPATLKLIERTISKISPDFVFSYSFLDEQFDLMYKRESNLQKLLEYFTGLAIFISCLGLIGLASFIIERKTKEIAIRKVLGAETLSVMGTLSKEFILLVIAANIIALPAAYYLMKKWIESFAYRTEIGITVFASSTLIVLFIAIFTISYQILIAANKNPAQSLKQE